MFDSYLKNYDLILNSLILQYLNVKLQNSRFTNDTHFEHTFLENFGGDTLANCELRHK